MTEELQTGQAGPGARIVRSRYDRIARFYDVLESPMERLATPWRTEIARELYGRVLEVGVGTGADVPYYPADIDVIAIDISGKMLWKAKAKFSDRNNVGFVQMDVERLAFADNTFDCVLTACVFCSVPDPVHGLREMRRVCKEGGKIVMLEHVRSERPLLGPLMDALNPIPLHLYGANINRRTLDNLRRAGLGNIDVEDLWLDIFKKIVVRNRKGAVVL